MVCGWPFPGPDSDWASMYMKASATTFPGLDIYVYGLLDPAVGAAGDNLRLLGATTLGIEVTVPELARRCGLGNIDPQHGGRIGTPSAAAIEACLTTKLPPTGSILATVRPDLDAFGAMALLALRRAGVEVGTAMRKRIDHAALADRFERGPWPGSRPLPATADEYASATQQDPVLIAVTGAMFDRELSPRDRVGLVARWLETGEEPVGYRENWAAHVESLVAGLASGAVAIEPRAGGRIALVASQLPGALRLGYCLAPLVVAEIPGDPEADPPAPRRVSIAQYAKGHADFGALRETLAAMEPGWGGSATILGSPQGLACRLTLETVLDAVTRHAADRGQDCHE